jgi:hypothetical protein
VQRNNKMEAALRELRNNPKLSVTQAAKNSDVNRRTLQDHWSKEKPIEVPIRDPKGRDLLDAAGLDPADWQIKKIEAKAAEGSDADPVVRVTAVPIQALDLSAVPAAPLPKPSPPHVADRSLAFCGDHHAPHQDPELHAAFCSFLSDERPPFLGVLGDVGDYASVSRHRAAEGFRQDVATCNQNAYDILHAYREASPDTQIVLMPGNHDARIEFYVQDVAEKLLGVGPAYQEDEPMYDLRRLWRLDELGVELVPGTWETAKYKVTPSLTMRHGYMVAKSNGEGMLNKHGRSGVQGHDHKLKASFKTKHDPLDVRVAWSAGCMCIVDEAGLGYAPEPDWQQGCLVGHAWEDGDFALAPAPYVSDKLLLPDGRRYG